jgi:5-methylcytosine-specific restriction endonuclease McrA
MASMMAILSKKKFKACVDWYQIGGLGDVVPIGDYPFNQHTKVLEGGTLFLVTVQPNDVLWLATIYEKTKKQKRDGEWVWRAEKNQTPLTDITHLKGELTFASGNGIRGNPGELGQELQMPRVLTANDEKLLWEAVAKAAPAPNQADEELEAFEGEERKSFVTHRKRESKLRDAKVDEVKKTTGKLCCETPGCGFDFLATYGKLGEDYIQVHHKKQLAKLEAPEQTNLSDLVVVCANCHVMIHRGGKCRELKTLLPLKKSPKKKV